MDACHDPFSLLSRLEGKFAHAMLTSLAATPCKHSMQHVAGPCKYEMHDEQLGWEEIQAEYDALSEREKQRCGETAKSVWQASWDPS